MQDGGLALVALIVQVALVVHTVQAALTTAVETAAGIATMVVGLTGAGSKLS